MRRNAIHLSGILFGLVAFVVMSLFATSGKADEQHARPSAAAMLPPMLMATPVETELLHEFSTAPVKVIPAAATPRPRVVRMEVTAYCPCKKCCGKNARGITASGLRVTHNSGLFVAADANVFDFHTKLKIPGYADGSAVPVLDRGGAIKGNKLDVFFPTHQEAKEWGRRMIDVTIVN